MKVTLRCLKPNPYTGTFWKKKKRFVWVGTFLGRGDLTSDRWCEHFLSITAYHVLIKMLFWEGQCFSIIIALSNACVVRNSMLALSWSGLVDLGFRIKQWQCEGQVMKQSVKHTKRALFHKKRILIRKFRHL